MKTMREKQIKKTKDRIKEYEIKMERNRAAKYHLMGLMEGAEETEYKIYDTALDALMDQETKIYMELKTEKEHLEFLEKQMELEQSYKLKEGVS